MVKKITAPTKSISSFNSPQAQGCSAVLRGVEVGFLISEGSMLKTRNFWWSHVLQEVWNQQEARGLFSLVAVLDGSCEPRVWREEARCQALLHTSCCVVPPVMWWAVMQPALWLPVPAPSWKGVAPGADCMCFMGN